MTDIEFDAERFEVRSVTRLELDRLAHYTQNMLVAAAAASLAIVGAAAFFVTLLL